VVVLVVVVVVVVKRRRRRRRGGDGRVGEAGTNENCQSWGRRDAGHWHTKKRTFGETN
jgi:hypothetical protein